MSGTLNGEIAVWELSPRTLSNSQNGQDQFRKLIFRDKAVPHYDCINSITVHADLRVAICSSQDASISVIDIEKCRVMRVIRLKSPVQNALLLSYPYYHYFINCERGQYSYSLNGQYLASS